MASSRDEIELLLNVEEQAEPINTLAILRKLENQHQLEETCENLKTVNLQEKLKYALPVNAATVGISSLGAYVFFLVKFFGKPDLAFKYINTIVSGINSSCGTLIPLLNDVCDNTFRKYGGDVCTNLVNDYLSIEKSYNYKFRSNPGYCRLYSCNSFFPFSNHTAYTSNFEFNRNISCANIYSGCIHYCHNAFEWCANLTIEASQILDKFNQPIPGYNYSCAEKYSSIDAFHQCESVKNVTCNEYRLNPHDSEWWSSTRIWLLICITIGLIVLLGSVAFLFIRGTSILNYKDNINELPNHDELNNIIDLCNLDADDINDEMKISDAITLLANNIAIIPDEKKLLGNMRFSFLLGRADPDSKIPANLPNDVARKIFHYAGLFTQPPVDKEYLSNMRFSFLLGRNDPDSTIPANLPDTVAHLIFHFSGLYTQPPVEQKVSEVVENDMQCKII